jgi:hypothetical protein
MVYRTDAGSADPRELAARLDHDPAVEAALFLEEGEAVARRAGEELRFAREDGRWRTSGDPAVLPQPAALERVWAALHNPYAGDLLVSAAEGFEFADLAGRAHLGGGSHGALAAPDSEVPLLMVGVEGTARSITDLAPLALAHFGVEPPAYARELAHAA